MRINRQSRKEIRFIFMIFILIVILMVGSKVNSLYQIHAMKSFTNDIFEYPLKMSNASLAVQSEINKMHRGMKDVVLSRSPEELEKKIKEINEHEHHVYVYLNIIRHGVKDETGKKLERDARELFRTWKPIRDEVIALVKNDQRAEAIAVTKEKGAKRVSALETSSLHLYRYAQNNANTFKKHSDALHDRFQTISILIGMTVLSLILLIAYYTISRIINYIVKTNHLTEVLSVIRDVNQLIVREKNKEKLVEEICNVLVSNRVYSNAWIALYDDSKRIKYVTSGDNSDNFVQLKTKLESGWIPPCIENVNTHNDGHLLIESTKESCTECPFTDVYENKGAFSIPLQHNEKIYGNLTLSVNTAFLKDLEEISLLHEVAGDISYALYNLETEIHLKEHECSLLHVKDLYENIIDSVDNILFVKNTDFTYIVCNEAFEKFVGKSRNKIVGKSDYDIFDKEIADFFREHDLKMFEDNKTKSNFEWVTYPDGHEVYLLTVKSPLHDSEGKLIGLVSNSVDMTVEKRAQEALLESEERFKLTIQQSPAIFELYDLNGTQIEVNHAYEELWGFPAAHTLNTFNLFKSEEVQKTGLIDHIQKAYGGEIVTVPPYEYDSTGSTEAAGLGRKRWLSTRIYPIKDVLGNVKNIVITHEDITEEIKSKKELRKSRENYQLLADNALDLIWKMNKELEFTYVNPAVKTLLGYLPEEFIGTKLKSHCSQKQFETVLTLVEHMLSTNTQEGVTIEASLYSKEGKEIPLEVNGKIIFDESLTPIGFQGSARDFTVQTEAREKLSDALDELEKKSRELQTILKEAPNPIMLHNEAGEVLMVNKVWESLSGYRYDEIDTIEKWTQRACHKKSLIMEKDQGALFSIDEKINLGENIVTSKEGNEMIWQVSSAPLGIINGKRTVVTSAMDITELKKKDELMMAQSRHAAMGEMIGIDRAPMETAYSRYRDGCQ